MSSQLVWQLVKNNNCFMHKGLNGVVLSKEPGNLYNVHCYKYSGELLRQSYLIRRFRRSYGCVATCAYGTNLLHKFPGSSV